MKKILLTALSGFILSIGSMTAQSLQQPFNKTISGWYTSTPIVLDGEFDEAVWQVRGQYNSATDQFEAPNSLLDRKINPNDPGTLAPTVPPAAPADELYTSHVTFTVAWDVNNLYLAISVIDTAVVNSHKPFGQKKAASTYLYYGVDNENRTDGTALSTKNEMEMGFFYNRTTPGILTENDISGFEGVTDYAAFGFIPGEYSVYFKPTELGYRLELALNWKRLNNKYVDQGNDEYTLNIKKPSNLRAFAFDLINNIPNHAGTDRQAKMSWNACCANTNYEKSINYGTLSLQGPITCNADECNTAGFTLTTSSPVISGNAPVQLSPVWVNANYTASINFSIVGAQLASVNSSGVLTPLGNGVVTIKATSADTSLHGQSFLVLTITNVFILNGITLQVPDINTNFGFSASTVFTDPSDLPGSARFSLDPPTNLAVINSVTGVVTATAYGNGTVTIKAVSLLDTTKSITKLISISNQSPPDKIYLMALIDSVQNCSSSPYNVTISGGSGEIVGFSAFYCNSSQEIITIPSQFISYQSNNVGISSLVNGSGSITNPASQTTITGTYKFNSTVTAPLITVLKRKVTPGCHYDFDAAAALINCGEVGETSLPEELSLHSLHVFPNPNDGAFNVSNDTNTPIDFAISNLLGSVVLSGHLQKGLNAISINAPSGIYFLKTGGKTVKIYIK